MDNFEELCGYYMVSAKIYNMHHVDRLQYPFITCTIDEEGRLWYYGAYETKDRALQAAREVNGVTLYLMED